MNRQKKEDLNSIIQKKSGYFSKTYLLLKQEYDPHYGHKWIKVCDLSMDVKLGNGINLEILKHASFKSCWSCLCYWSLS